MHFHKNPENGEKPPYALTVQATKYEARIRCKPGIARIDNLLGCLVTVLSVYDIRWLALNLFQRERCFVSGFSILYLYKGEHCLINKARYFATFGLTQIFYS